MASLQLPSLHHLFLAAVSTTLAGCGGAASSADSTGTGTPEGTGGSAGGTEGTGASGGTGGDRGSGGGGTAGGESLPAAECVSGTFGASLVAGLRTEPPADFIATLARSDAQTEADTGKKYRFAESEGTACATAVDVATCDAELETLLVDADSVIETQPWPHYVVTRADGLSTYFGREAIVDLLGTIDTPNEAVFVAETYSPCDAVEKTAGGYTISATAYNCETFATQAYEILVAADGTVTNVPPDGYQISPCAVVGRLTDDLTLPCAANPPSGLLGYLVEAAECEAAAIAAFARIAQELQHFGAPEELVAGARRAAGDELEHARRMHEQARSRGARPAAVISRPHARRSLLDFAIENATEGCVSELFSAARAHFQAERAEDASLRRDLKLIAEDETRHAELSLAIHEWCIQQLGPELGGQVEAARRDAISKLRSELAQASGEGLREAGVPDATQARALCDAVGPLLAA